MIYFPDPLRKLKDKILRVIRQEVAIQKLRFGFRDEHGNSITMSQFTPPQNEGSLFEENDARVSCLLGLDLKQSRFSGNRFQASQVSDIISHNSRVIKNSLNSSTINDLLLEDQSCLQESTLNGSHLNHLQLREGSYILTSRFEGSHLENFTINEASIIENCRLIGLSLKNVSWTRVRFNGVRFYGVTFIDSVWNEVDLNRCSFRNCRFIGTQISGVKLRDLKISHVDFSGLTITSSEEFTEVFMNHRSNKINLSNKP